MVEVSFKKVKRMVRTFRRYLKSNTIQFKTKVESCVDKFLKW
jgi:hypothetical protein